MSAVVSGSSSMGQTYDQLNILDLPDIMLLQIFEKAEFSDLPSLSLTCWSFNRIAWTTYWDRIFSHSDRLTHPQDTILTTAVKRLEPLFESDNERDKLLIGYFFNRLAGRNVTTQVNFVRNVFRAIRPQDFKARDPRFEALLKYLFHHAQSPMLCKLKVHSFALSMLLPISDELTWATDKGSFEGCTLPSYPQFSFGIVPYEVAETMHVSPENEFKEDEIVCILDKGSFSMGKFSLFFGKVLGKNGSLWKVYLEHDGNGNWSSLRLKKPEEIGKIPFSEKISYFLKYY